MERRGSAAARAGYEGGLGNNEDGVWVPSIARELDVGFPCVKAIFHNLIHTF